MIHTNRCFYCGKTKEKHYGMKMVNLNPDDDVWEIGFGDYCANKKNRFTDSGLAALDAHKEELYAFVLEVSQAHPDSNQISLIKKAQSILNQIEKEK